MKFEVTLFCEDVSKNHTHCNRYKVLTTSDPSTSIQELIGDSEWGLVSGQVRCEEHNDD